jgi:hypothetical protein
VLVATGCIDRHTVVDVAMTSAYRPTRVAFVDADVDGGSPFTLLAGDFHCHVSPPDWDQEANRDLAGTVELAKKEHLDFVVLTPHVGARFFLDDDQRQEEVQSLAWLRGEIAKQASDAPLLIAGFEYTDHEYGHVGFSFGDLDKVLAALPTERLWKHPDDFIKRWVASGGLLVVNHPLVTPLDTVVPIGQADLSWRPWTADGPFPPEINAVNTLAQGFEAYNLTAAHMRDRYLSHEGPGTFEDTLARIDEQILGQHRRLVPMGGSDSHENHLRATTFVLARTRSAEGIHEAVLAGRVCVRDPRACSLEARQPGGAWQPLGAAFTNAKSLELRARGEKIQLFVNGKPVVQPRSNEPTSLPLDPGVCSVIRAEIDGGASAPIYANCSFAIANRPFAIANQK